MPPWRELYARLDKTRTKVLCPACKTEICQVRDNVAGLGDLPRHLTFSKGWVWDREYQVWRQIQHARENERRGYAPSVRKPDVVVIGEDRAEPWRTARTLPVRAKCPRCPSTTVLILDAARLDVTTLPTP